MAGIPTLEAIHTWDGQVALNDRRDLDPTTRRWRYWCDQIDLRNLAEPELPSDLVVGGLGAIARPGARGGVTVTYEGRIEALSTADLRDATDVLLSAFLDVRAERQVQITFQPTYRTDAFYFNARGTVSVKDAPRLHGAPTPYQATFVIAMVRSDPRVYDATTSGPYATGALPVLTGLQIPLQVPFTIPYRLPVTGEVSFTVGGRAPSPGVLTVHGPCRRPQVALDTSTLMILDADIAAGQTAVVDFAARTVTVASQLAPWTVVWPASTWWDSPSADLKPGPHTMRFTADYAEPPARAELTYRAAYP